MELPKNLLDCSKLQIARDIPKELSFYKSSYTHLVRQNHLYKKTLMVTGVGIGMCIIYIIVNHYVLQKKKKTTQE